MGRSVRNASVAALSAAFLVLVALTPALAVSPGVVVGYSDTIRSFSKASPITVDGPSLAAGTWWVRVTAELDASGSAAATGETECDLTDGSTALDQAFWLLDYGHPTGAPTCRSRSPVYKRQQLPGRRSALLDQGGHRHCPDFIRIDAIGSVVRECRRSTRDRVERPDDRAGRWCVPHRRVVRTARRQVVHSAKTNVVNASLATTTDVTCRISPSSHDVDRSALSLNGKTLTGGEGEIAARCRA